MDNAWKITPSQLAMKSANPIHEFLTKTKENSLRATSEDQDNAIIDLSTGDLCSAPDEIINSLIETIMEGRHNGYAPSVGYEDTRQAILDYLKLPAFGPKDIILSSGTSSCLDIAITALADRDQNILLPKPCNPHYKLLANGLGIETKEYRLNSITWDVDLLDLRQQIDATTALILINNPHNPTGALYTHEHIKDILEVAHRHRVPVVVDEAYRDVIFPGVEFVSAVEVNTKVPLLVCGGVGRSFMVPGWRVGWILVHDPVEAFVDVRKALVSLSQRIIGCNTVLQGAICQIANANVDFRHNFMQTVQSNCMVLRNKLDKKYGICINAGRSIFCFVRVDLDKYQEFDCGEEFCRRLYEEVGVLILPGELFGMGGYVKIALDLTSRDMEEAVARIEGFCRVHYS